MKLDKREKFYRECEYNLEWKILNLEKYVHIITYGLEIVPKKCKLLDLEIRQG